MFAKLFNNCLFGGDQQPSSSNSADGGGGEKQRVVRANDRAYNAPFKYATNFIKTSKYSLLTFLPRNLYQQFTRIANFYFLVLLCLQFFPQIASVPWMYTLVPLSCVLACSAVKDAFDDLQRHRSDRQVNSRVSYVVRNSRLESEKWMDVRVGDIVRMENEHFIAADLLLLSTSESHGLCYIETAELDGETNLKTRVALAETVPLNDRLRDISEFDGEIICEPPNNRLDHFEGRLEWRGSAIPLDNRNMLLRGCRLRNTRWCYGMVVFAGKDTKLMQNSGHAPTKRTSLDRFLNLLILGIVLFLLAMCLICTMMSGLWEHVTGRQFRVFLPWDEFVVSTKQVLSMPTSFNGISLPASDDEETDQNSVGPSKALIIAALQFFSYMILLNTVVPISLYISVEMIRLAHSKFINNDIKMYDDKTDTPARARTSTLNEELGQVQYVFSDKTGTLTQNIMVFKKCSINGRSYGDVMTERGEIVPIDEETETPPALDFSDNHWHEPHFRFYDRTLMEDTRRGVEEVHEFWRLLAICHTVMPERKPGKVLEYQAQSPDEAALTSAARNFGFVFKSRTPKSITIEVNGAEEVYEVLHILDFDNVRKRMSVLVRNATRTVLYCKGADTMILDRLSARGTSELLRSATHQHLDKFATDGLRTLCTAYKPVDAEYCSKWVDRLRTAQLDSQRKDELVEALYEEMEQDMLLLGATAIEDKLQDGVPQTIATLAAANIKIWVLTGDKTETAINIGYSCRLLTEEMREVFIIDGKEEKEVEVQLKDTRRRICSAKQTQQPSVGVSSFYPSPSTPLAPSPSLLESPYSANLPSPPPSNGGAPSVLPIVNGATMPTTAFANGTTEGSTKTKNASVHSTRFVSVESPRSTATNGGQMDSGRSRQVTASEAEKGTEAEEKRKSGGSEAAEDEENGGREGEYALVINGEALAHALKRKYEKTLLEIGANCTSVICCRVTPLQKAQVVDLVKRNVKAVTLAIGDGANDVSMIRTAHIGVGISGQEGMQAVLSSDFSIGQFRFLERLLLVHGRWSYLRMCKFLRYFFYKNFAYTLPHFWYSFFCGFSAQTVYDPVLISMYNLCFTALPVLAMAIFDQDVDEEYSTRFPRLYIPGQFNLFFNMRIFIHSIIHGMISSLVLFFVPFGALFRAVSENGRGLYDYSLFAFTAYTALMPFSVLVVTGQIAFDTAYWTWINWLVVGGSLAFYVLTVFVCYQVPFSQLITGTYNFGVAARAVRIPEFWLSLLLICVILLVPVIANRFFWFDTHPSYSDRLRVRHRFCMEPSDKAPTAEAMKQTAPITKTGLAKRSLRSGYAFSHCSGFGELIAKGTMFKNIEHLRIPSFQFALHHDSHSNHRSRRHSLSRVHPALSSANSSTGHSSDQQILNPIVLNSDNDDGEGAAVSSMTHFSPTSSNMTTTTTLGGGNAKSQQKIRPILPPPPAVPNSSRLHQSQHHSHQYRHHKHHQPTSTRRSTIESLVIEQPPSADDEKDDGMTPMITQIVVVKEEDEEGDEVIRATEQQQRVGSSNYQQGTTPTELISGSDQYGKSTELVDSTDQHWSSERVEASDHYGKSTADDRPLSERDNESRRMVTAYSARPIDMARPNSELKHNLVVNAELEDEEDQRSEMPTPNTSHSFVVNAELDDDVPSLPSHWLRKADTMPKLFDANELAMTSVEQTAAAEHGKTFVSKTRRKSSSSSATSQNSREMRTVKMDSQRNRQRVFTGKKPRQGERQRESEEETTKV